MQLQTDSKAEEIRRLRQANADSSLRLTNLTDEVETIRAQLEDALQQRDQATRQMTRASSDADATCSALEGEKETLRQHVQRLKEELDTVGRRQANLNSQLHDAQVAYNALQQSKDDTEHQLLGEIDQLKLK